MHNNRKTLLLTLSATFVLMALLVAYFSGLMYKTAYSHVHELGNDKTSAITADLENYLENARSVLWVAADTVDHMVTNGAANDEIVEYITRESANTASQFDESYTGLYGYINGEYVDGVACFGQAFLELHPTKYAEELVKKMEKSGAKAYLVNTGWNGTGKRISIKDTRGIIDAILDGDILNAPTKKIPYFNFEVPTELKGVDTGILDPRDTYKDPTEWDAKAKDLAGRFIKNFAKYESNEAGKALVAAGPQL